MKAPMLIGTAASLLLAGTLAAQDPTAVVVDQGPEHHLVHHPGQIGWQPGPASLGRGAEIAVLEGDPSKPGVFTLRLRMPDGFVISPHWHPNPERITVISGTFLLGSGAALDRTKTERLQPGSYTSLPPEMPHYAITEGETVVQLTSTGPWKINYVNPADDPRRSSR